ncbi:hypothetical protein BO99DRAFT_193172 [Aspergillus violaceofuscus CBS 115571]|uniref:Uncharacterized protein n=1 Tax=Aspergillus violaceofuscus (strain CBS 115571) TaxID=1450538 RepID=A0A2V5H1L8_ASPV1|nr:hypothetical protein BO99DRAFT_193172 [Aspergillus violaceofuscus CBS 115571]
MLGWLGAGMLHSTHHVFSTARSFVRRSLGRSFDRYSLALWLRLRLLLLLLPLPPLCVNWSFQPALFETPASSSSVHLSHIHPFPRFPFFLFTLLDF